MRKMFVAFFTSCMLSVLSVVGITAAVQPAAATGGFQSTLGKEFWVNFDNNPLVTTRSPKLYLAGAQNASVTITWPDGTTQQETVVAGAVTTVDANSKINIPNRYTVSTDGISQTSVRIVSDAAISVYVMNQQTSTSDASQAYPTEYQGYEYRVLTANNAGGARFSVIANEPGTTIVTITPKATLGTRVAGVAYTQTLQQGDVYSNLSNSGSRGTLITSDKKITVTSSHTCTNLGVGSCDFISEFIPPVKTWGKSFLIPASINQNPLSTSLDRFAVMASADNTLITVNGVTTTLALAGDAHDSLIPSMGVNMTITSDKPVAVMQFVRKGSYSNGIVNRSGDPAMVLVTPVVQFLNDVLITTPATGFDINTISLVVREAETTVLTLNGSVITPNLFSSTVTVGSENFKIARVHISLGAHRITSTNGFGVFVYGFNPADSYAYAAGAGMVDLDQYPGGVAQVGYVAANLIGTPSQNGSSQQQPVVEPPRAVAIFFNRKIPIGTTGTLRLSGVNLTGLTSLKIGNQTVEIVSSGDGFAEIKFSALAAGVYNFSTTGTNAGGSWIGSQEAVLTVVGAAPTTNPGVVKFSTLAIRNFPGGSSVLTSEMKSRITAEVAKHPGIKSVECVGTTSGPTVLRVDASLAQRRATAVCSLIASMTPKAITTTIGKNTLVLGGGARAVTVTLRF